MGDMNIEKQARTSDDLEQGAAASEGGSPGSLAELEKLAELHDQGVVIDEESTKLKRRLIGTE
jgi:hypothetical protein